ncbi:MAG: hypothetical protein IT539_08010 [Bradyrhizobiaceae bacterium]|nr:hypothetical protein [Bradyrhizobiaceae bacterium]
MHTQLHSRMTALRALAAVGAIALFLAAQSAGAQENTDAFVESQFAAMPAQPLMGPATPANHATTSFDSVELDEEAEGTTGTTAEASPPACAFVSTALELEGCIPPLPDAE